MVESPQTAYDNPDNLPDCYQEIFEHDHINPNTNKHCLGEAVSDEDRGEVVCSKCGYVFPDKIVDRGPERRAYSIDEKADRVRTGPAESPLYQTSTTFRPNEKELDLDKRRTFRRLKRYDNKEKFYEGKGRNITIALSEIKRLSDSDKLNLPEHVRERAAAIYREALSKDLVRGRTIHGMAAASLYAALRKDADVKRTLSEVEKYSTEEKGDVARLYRLLLRELKLKMPVPMAEYNISKIINKLKLDQQTEEIVKEILVRVRENKETDGRNPSGLGAAAVYCAVKNSDHTRTQKDIAAAAGITEVTLRNRYKRWENKPWLLEILQKYKLN